jgi:hypothetical protein
MSRHFSTVFSFSSAMPDNASLSNQNEATLHPANAV